MICSHLNLNFYDILNALKEIKSSLRWKSNIPYTTNSDKSKFAPLESQTPQSGGGGLGAIKKYPKNPTFDNYL